MYQRQTVYKHRHIIAVIICCTVLFAKNVLIDDLQAVVVDVFLVDESNILGHGIISFENLDIIFLDFACLFDDAIIFVGNAVGKEPFPFCISECIAIELFQLDAKVGNQVGFRVNGKVFIALFTE